MSNSPAINGASGVPPQAAEAERMQAEERRQAMEAQISGLRSEAAALEDLSAERSAALQDSEKTLAALRLAHESLEARHAKLSEEAVQLRTLTENNSASLRVMTSERAELDALVSDTEERHQHALVSFEISLSTP